MLHQRYTKWGLLLWIKRHVEQTLSEKLNSAKDSAWKYIEEHEHQNQSPGESRRVQRSLGELMYNKT